MLPGSRLEDHKSTLPSEKQISRIKREFFAEIDRLFGDETPKRAIAALEEKRPSEANSKTRTEMKVLSPNCISPLFDDDKLANVESTSHMIRQGTVREYLTYLSNRTHILEHLSKRKSIRKKSGKWWNHHCRRLGCAIFNLLCHNNLARLFFSISDDTCDLETTRCHSPTLVTPNLLLDFTI